MNICPPPVMSRKIGRTEFWPTAIEYRQEDDRLVGRVLAWGPKHSKADPAPEPKSRRGVAAQGALNL